MMQLFLTFLRKLLKTTNNQVFVGIEVKNEKAGARGQKTESPNAEYS